MAALMFNRFAFGMNTYRSGKGVWKSISTRTIYSSGDKAEQYVWKKMDSLNETKQ
jgi:hypothetical protein